MATSPCYPTPMLVEPHLPIATLDKLTLPGFLAPLRAYPRTNTVYWRGCVSCWREQPVFLLPWYLDAVTACPRHLVLLTSHCPCCSSFLPMSFQAHLACPQCKTLVRDFPTSPIHQHLPSVALTQALWQILAGQPPHQAIYPLAPDHPLHSVVPAHFWTFLVSFIRIFGNALPQSTLYDLNPLQAEGEWVYPPPRLWDNIPLVHRLAIAVWLSCVHWPHAWYTFLGELARWELLTYQGGGGRLRVAAIDARWSAPPWDPTPSYQWWGASIQALRQFRPWVHGYHYFPRHPLELEDSDKQRLEICKVRLHYCRVQRPLDRTLMPPPPTPRREHWYLLETEAYTFHAEDELIPRTTLRDWWQVTDHQLAALMAAGLLPFPYANAWYMGEIQASLTQWLGHLPVRVCPLAEQPLFCAEILRAGARVKLRLPTLLLAIQRGELQAWRMTHRPALTGLWTTPLALSAFLRERQRCPPILCREEQVMVQLCCTLEDLQDWYASGQLVPWRDETSLRGVCWWYDATQVEHCAYSPAVCLG